MDYEQFKLKRFPWINAYPIGTIVEQTTWFDRKEITVQLTVNKIMAPGYKYKDMNPWTLRYGLTYNNDPARTCVVEWRQVGKLIKLPDSADRSKVYNQIIYRKHNIPHKHAYGTNKYYTNSMHVDKASHKSSNQIHFTKPQPQRITTGGAVKYKIF